MISLDREVIQFRLMINQMNVLSKLFAEIIICIAIAYSSGCFHHSIRRQCEFLLLKSNRFRHEKWMSFVLISGLRLMNGNRHATRLPPNVPFSVELKLRLQFPLCATLALVLFCENENKVLKRWTWNRIRSTRAHNTQHLPAKTAFNKCSSDSRSGERFHRKWFDSKCLRVDSNSAKRNVFVLPFAVRCESDEQENEFIRGTNK